MIIDLLTSVLCTQYENKILVIDKDKIINSSTENWFINENWKVLYYLDVECFRYKFESEIRNNNDKYLVIIRNDIYIPYDVRREMYVVDIAIERLFPKLNSYAIKNNEEKPDLDLLSIAYENHYGESLNEADTYGFLAKDQYETDTLQIYIDNKIREIENLLKKSHDYKTWFEIADIFGYIRFLISKVALVCDVSGIHTRINGIFEDFILKNYNMLSTLSYYDSPVLLNNVLDYMFLRRTGNEKMALLVIDGMSVLDWKVIQSQMSSFDCDVKYSFALIPTTTSISRQSLLSGKLPLELEKPFDLSQEERLFYDKASEMGVKKRNIQYHKGYDYSLSGSNKIAGLIFNDIDDIVHKQTTDDNGMYSDVLRYCKTGKLDKAITHLLDVGYRVFLTSDHGNTRSIGIGKAPNRGIEMESKCQKVLVYKEYSDVEEVLEKFNLLNYPKYHLPKNLHYLLCKQENAFGTKNEVIHTHGGITLEEVIVPFVEVKELS